MNQNQQGQQGGQQPQDDWQSVQPSNENPKWEPEAMEKNEFAFNPDSPPFLIGYYVKDRQIKSTFNDGFFTVSEIQTINPDKTFGPAVDVAQNVVLQDRLSKVKMGTFIKITYLGKQLKKGLPNQPWSKTNSFHIWDVAENLKVMNLNELLGKSAPEALNVPAPQNAAPQNNTPTNQSQGQFNQNAAPQNQQFSQQAPQNQGQQFNPGAQQNQQFQPQPGFNQNAGQQQFSQNPAQSAPVQNQQFGNQTFTPAPQNPAQQNTQGQQFNANPGAFHGNPGQGNGQQFNPGTGQGNPNAGVKFGNETVSGDVFHDKNLPF